MRAIIYSIITVLLAINASAQLNICYEQIDSLKKAITGLPCSHLDIGIIEKNNNARYRECYIMDSANKELRAISTFVMDSTLGIEFIDFYFFRNELIKVETGHSNTYKKFNNRYYYYTHGSCEYFSPDKYYNTQKLLYKRLSQIYIERWEEKIKTRSPR